MMRAPPIDAPEAPCDHGPDASIASGWREDLRFFLHAWAAAFVVFYAFLF